MKSAFISLLLVVSFAASFSQRVPEAWLTDYEKSGFKRTPNYEQTLEYCRKLAKASPWIRVTNFGKSPEGRDLTLIIASKEKAFTPEQARKSGKAILLIQNGIHAGEIDGKDACLMLLRDMVIAKTKAKLLDNVIVLVLPFFNVDGHERIGRYNRINQDGPEEMGWRTTSHNLNLNRDYVKADAPEMQAWLKMFNAWMPDFLIDAHVTDGADYQYAVTYAIEQHENVAPPVRSWVKSTFQPMLDTLKIGGLPLSPYIFFRDDYDQRKGIWGGTAPPRFSTVYSAICQNRPGLLIETHMLKNYKTRVDGTYGLIEATIQKMNQEHRSLRDAVRQADESTARGLEAPFPLQFEVVDTPNQTIHFLGIKQRNDSSTISGGVRITYTDETWEETIPRYDSVRVTRATSPPVAYLIPKQYTEIIRRLQLHGLRIERLAKPVELDVEQYRIANVKWQEQSFEGRHPLTYSASIEKVKKTFPAGTAVVRLQQRAARAALHALEPDGPDSFLAWGFFDASLEQKEYAEAYVMEKLAPDMIADNPELYREFQQKLATDSSFAKSPEARLNFFYRHSPYWDERVNLYPVARLMNQVSLSTEPWK